MKIKMKVIPLVLPGPAILLTDCDFQEMEEGDVLSSFNFAYSMSFGREGEHRPYRTGGTRKRTTGEIFANAFQGKLAEFAVYRVLSRSFSDISEPDTSAYERGRWDAFDCEVQGEIIAVKSTKEYGNLLLLEAGDWDENGNYVQNWETEGQDYAVFILVRISPNCETIMKKAGLLFLKEAPKEKLEIPLLQNPLNQWLFDIPGFATKGDVKCAIASGLFLRKGDKLGSYTEMDAGNYYIQSGDLRTLSELKNYL